MADFPRFKKLHYYLIPLVAMVVWWGMLIALLACWAAQGKPVYAFMTTDYQDPVFLSDIAATNLNPLFISCVGFQLIFFVGTLVTEYVLRKKRKLQPYVSKKQPRFAFVSIVMAVIGQLAILMVSIFKTSTHRTVHLSMLGVFIFFTFWACFFNILITYAFGNFPQRLHPNHERVVFGRHRWLNVYMVSFFAKLVWLVLAVVFVVSFGANSNRSTSAVFEWIICFWYGFLLIFWSMDLFPSAVKHYRVHHSEKFDDEFIDNHQNPPSAMSNDESTDGDQESPAKDHNPSS
ncbi:hypothetical protein METBIDRAFT_78998 [Metschnikowia bicuspidata var. bicuspidata NRRL YB-4993]|uniref:CWH43-like N-terminal domain-containing protein n=1 Tax=Metschnikowia bicuspidata var. bicuspidata NRRL YB-4993 TaxID=869754 RepID=A0A1A0H9P2_9ASCO|nr:hypothetical protein METBIDRAFT_78998 [Metschnikowia bicuspidata var. bicuspidata NRRL YB-4993]OBA20710.1 hypothetical protein METBIDRAFT_78998 [Metschnikowia bicuspidata var. bicuspidata NRRL YB-4993]